MAPKKNITLEEWFEWLIKTVYFLLKCGAKYEDLKWQLFCDELRKQSGIEVTVDDIQQVLDSKLCSSKIFEELLESNHCKWDSDRSMITYAGQNTVVAQNMLREFRRHIPPEFDELKFIAACRSKSLFANSSSVRQGAGPSSVPSHSRQSAWPPMGYPFWQPAVPLNVSPFFHFGGPSNANASGKRTRRF